MRPLTGTLASVRQDVQRVSRCSRTRLVEIVSKHRFTNVTLSQLSSIAQRPERIKITGQLLFGNAHKMRRRPDEKRHREGVTPTLSPAHAVDDEDPMAGVSRLAPVFEDVQQVPVQ